MLELRSGLPRVYDDMSMTREEQEFIYGLVRALKPMLVVETGTYRGLTAEAIGNAIADNGIGELVTIEINPELARQAAERCAGLPVSVVCADCREYASMLWTGIDLLIIDGGEDRRSEEQAFEGHLAPGAVIVRHDATNPTGTYLQGDELEDWLVLPSARGLAVRRAA